MMKFKLFRYWRQGAIGLFVILSLAVTSQYALAELTISSYNINSQGNLTLTFDGTTFDTNKTTLGVTDPTANRTITLPDNSGLVPLATAANTLFFTTTANTSLILPTSGTLATLAGAETLTNKTLTAPVMATISNTGTLTLPTATDTLVGRATTDTLTNKTLSTGSTWQGSIIGSAYGGTGNGFTKFTGPTTTEKTFTLPDASAAILTTNTAVTVAQGGTGVSTLTGLVKGNGASAFSVATSGTDYSAGTSALATGILKSTTTTGALTIAVAGDFPTLNQNTTGTAAGLSATLAVAGGGTGATTLTGILVGDGTNTVTAITGTASQVLRRNAGNTAYEFFTLTGGDMVLADIQTVTGAKTFNSGKLILAGATSGTTIFNAAAVAGTTTITLPGASGTILLTDGSAASLTSFPTLNQNTTGSAATLTTARTINGVSFNGSANITIPSDITPGASGNVLTSNGTIWTSATPAVSGTVTSVSVVSANGFTGTVATATTTPAITLTTSITGLLKGNGTAMSAATAGTDYSAGTSALATGILKSTTTTGALTIAVAGDFPTLNQNTTGSAATLTTARTIGGVSFNGSANITVATATGGFTVSGGALALGANDLTMSGSIGVTGTRITKGWFTDVESTNTPTVGGVALYGVGNAFFTVSGPATTAKTFTFPNANSTVLTSNDLITLAQGGTGANLTASNGGILYSTASAGAILAGTATAGQILRSGASAAPTWSTATYPATAGTSGNVLTSNGTNFVSQAASSGSLTGIVSSDFVTTSTTYVDITEASVNVEANTTYFISFMISTVGSSLDWGRVQWNYPTGLTLFGVGLYHRTATDSGSILADQTSTFAVSNTENRISFFSGKVVVGSTAGILKLQFKKDADTDFANVFFKKGSGFILIKQ
ncbi:MAG: hypothetical protein HY973_03970 [Candidatus Kerfeldbacteria bacterium]|nr:hypothetical protein [Candidatus Kerfeldbacteria bacterium]